MDCTAPPPAAINARAADILRGTSRLLVALGMAPMPEVKLKIGRRVDIMALGRDGAIWVVEIKSCRTDFLTDAKWPEYLDHADRFFFAVDTAFPVDLLPSDEGLILADRFGAEVVRDARHRPLAAARRKALSLAFARCAAMRLHELAEARGNIA